MYDLHLRRIVKVQQLPKVVADIPEDVQFVDAEHLVDQCDDQAGSLLSVSSRRFEGIHFAAAAPRRGSATSMIDLVNSMTDVTG